MSCILCWELFKYSFHFLKVFWILNWYYSLETEILDSCRWCPLFESKNLFPYELVIFVLQISDVILTYFYSVSSNWTASSEFGTYRLCERRRFRRACEYAQSRQNLRCSLIQALNQEEPSHRKPDPWPLWMAGHDGMLEDTNSLDGAQLVFTAALCTVHLSKSDHRHWRISNNFLRNSSETKKLF